MKTTFCIRILLLGLFVGAGAIAAAQENVGRVSTTRSLRVDCVRDTSEDSPWYVMQQAFATSLSACLAGKDMTTMPVKMSAATAARASGDLIANECDAVLFIGDQLPSELRGDRFVSYRAVSQIGTPVRVFHFLLRSNDPAMQAVLAKAFEKATSSASFQDTIGRASAMHIVASNSNR